MTSARRRALIPCAAVPIAVIALIGCGADLADEDGPLGGGSLDQSVSSTQAQAPDPTGEQLSHEQMREALQENTGGTITDTDDWWPHLRDLNRELQMLRVQPADCKPYVIASALPVPTGALGALAEEGETQTVIFTFEDIASAQEYLQSERDGIERCQEHTVIRDLGESQVEAETELTELSVRSGAEDVLAVRRVMETEDNIQSHLAVLLRQGAQLVLAAEPEDEETEEDEALAELEATAAHILSGLVGEEILAPEPEPEDEDDEDDRSDDGDADNGDEADDDDA